MQNEPVQLKNIEGQLLLIAAAIVSSWTIDFVIRRAVLAAVRLAASSLQHMEQQATGPHPDGPILAKNAMALFLRGVYELDYRMARRLADGLRGHPAYSEDWLR